MKRTYMDVRFDVTDLDETQRGHLALEVAVQAEESDEHPGVQEPIIEWNEVEEETRTILCHLNVEVPADDPRDAGQIAQAIDAALTVGIEGGPDEVVGGIEFSIPLAEEV